MVGDFPPAAIMSLLRGGGKVRMTQPKPGWKTTEFWLTLLAQVIGLVLMSGLLCTDHDGPTAAQVCKILGTAVSALSLLGYQASRAVTKGAHAVGAADAPYDPTKS